ncbi:agamous-like MADS-box protein AGL80 [Chenopodium quinoa]|uniref:agamous-like MADS-box protein AGL80 n=1 Tax=Chenopodium quinoa TaxID=63459 RepID=UPI000B78FD33|nr:agamous-like MADS-box protein AGL80 [Chenopodium quinoa]
MVRKKVKLAYIENDSCRRVTYRKRVKNLVKKTRELSVLCGVDACAIIYGQDEQAPVVWPSSEEEAKRIISDYNSKSELDPSQRGFNQYTFLNDSVIKAKERLLKLQRKNREKQIANMVSDILSGKSSLDQVNPNDLGDLLWVIEDKIRTIQYRIRVTKEEGDNNNNNPPISESIN